MKFSVETSSATNTMLLDNAELKLELFYKTVGFAEFDAEGNVLHANEIFLGIHGYKEEELSTLNHRELLPESKREEYWKSLLNGGRNEGEFLRLKKDGSYIWVKAKYHLIQKGEAIEGVYKIITDISEHKRSQLQLSQQFTTLNKAAIVSETNAQGQITFVNKNFCEVSKYSEQELIGQTHHIINSGIQPQPMYTELWKTITNGNVWQGVLCNKSKDGTYYWEHITISPFRNLQGKIYKYVNVGFDITEQVTQKIALKQKTIALRKKHQDLEKINSELDKAYQHKTEFLANMSHELRTPLNAVLLLSSLLKENPSKNLTSEQVEYATIINSSGNNLLQLINDVLDASKFEAGRMEANLATFSLFALLDSINSSFYRLAENKNLDYRSTKNENVPDQCFGDELKTQQVLKNLLSNAIKFTEKGEVSLITDTVQVNGITQVEFKVSDTGIGISEEDIPLIFKAFRQVDGTTSRKYKGTGLGLSISKKITQLLRGTLDVKSEPGKGSTFTLRLPILID